MLQKLFFISILSSFIFTHSHNTRCLHHQKSLLLQLKNELTFDSLFSTKLVQWDESNDCCNWSGVECDVAGHVIGLELDDEAISGGIGDSSSLFRLTYLKRLNLASNIFDSTPIPRGIHKLTCLTHLNLSNADFSGKVPDGISSLRNLVSLDISNYGYGVIDGLLTCPNLTKLLSKMTWLRELYLDGANITSSHKRLKWSHIISSYLPHLEALSLRNCFLSGSLASSFWKLESLSVLLLDYNDLSTEDPTMFASFSSLTTLSVVNCSLKGSFPNTIFHIPSLQNLDLSNNELLSGSIPSFTRDGSLRSLKLSFTNFSGSIPSSISNHKYISEIDLSYSKFTGSIPSTFANLTRLTSVNLENNFFTGSLSSTLFEGLFNLVYLVLEYNSFYGNIPKSLFGLPSLQELKLCNNKFSGLVGEFHSVNASSIVWLDFSDNRLEGPIPDSFFQLQSLEYFSLSANLFNGTFQLDKIQSLPNLDSFDLSGNKLYVHVSNDKSTSFRLPNLFDLHLPSCNMKDFPHFIRHSSLSGTLDLSNNRISGEIPSWIWKKELQELNLSFNLFTSLQKPYHIPSSLLFLDLHSNQLEGDFRRFFPPNIKMQTFDLENLILGNNSFSGSIPTSLCTATSLEVLDLSVNKLSGNIPSCLLDNSIFLIVLDLGRNNFSGRIPDNFSCNSNLKYLDLNNNTLRGEIPKSLEICKSLEFMNVGNNVLNGTFPCMLPTTLRALILHSNRFQGEVTCRMRWPDLQILDISSNNFSGSLESIEFPSWKAMVVENDTQSMDNYYYLQSFGVTLIMKGLVLKLVKIWPEFSTIDFSGNNFRGEIPNAIGDLSLLHLLNLSHNALNGSIPKSFGKLGKLESLDLSENRLTGEIPVELGGLTFLSFLNLSYNKLVGEIPNGRQLQTFSADSFKGNAGLCGFNLNISCIVRTDDESDLSPGENESSDEEREVEWEYVSAALGYVVGLGIIAWLLLFCRRFKEKYFGKIDEVVEEMFDARDRRRRRRSHARRVERNRVRGQ